MKREVADFIEDIVGAMDKAVKFVEGMSYESFAQDDKTVFAVIRAIEVIGEAVKHMPNDVKDAYPEVPWKAMGSMRDKVIHEYFGVDLGIVWETVQTRIPEIRPLFDKILEDLRAKER